jgi:hypothetical protein
LDIIADTPSLKLVNQVMVKGEKGALNQTSIKNGFIAVSPTFFQTIDALNTTACLISEI